MKNLTNLSDLEAELKARYSPISTEFESFGSAEMLRIYFQDRYFVVAMTAPDSVCLDEPKEEDGMTSSFRHHFDDLLSTLESLVEMMSKGKELLS